MPDVPAPIPPKPGRLVQMLISIDPASGGMQIQHPGVSPLGVVEILGNAAALMAREIHAAEQKAAATKIQVAGPAALRALP